MDQQQQRYFELAARLMDGTITDAERQEYAEWLQAAGQDGKALEIPGDFVQDRQVHEERMLKAITKKIDWADDKRIDSADRRPMVHRVHFLRRSGWWAAAAVLILLVAGGIYMIRPRASSVPVVAASVTNDVRPGKNGALLTLSDGRQVLLDSLNNGVVAVQADVAVKLKDGKLLYDKTNGAGPGNAGDGRGNAGQIAYNTMSTPRGRQFQLVLPDGTKVWLNAASSLRYPTSFTGNDRRVEINGEAYFEVAKDVQRPFRVVINEETEVEVLGTDFNVNAYKDEPAIATTLLEGAVRVVSKKKAQLLSPGQQVQVKSGGLKLIKDADVAQATAWKNGSFSFVNADLPTVMRQVARWYNVDVEYKGAIPAGEFNGKIGNSLTLDQLLKGLAKTRINYRIESGNKILILP